MDFSCAMTPEAIGPVMNIAARAPTRNSVAVIGFPFTD